MGDTFISPINELFPCLLIITLPPTVILKILNCREYFLQTTATLKFSNQLKVLVEEKYSGGWGTPSP